MTSNPPRLTGLSLASRLLLNNVLVIVAGAGTVLVTALLVGPAVFEAHLQTIEPIPDPLVQEHVARAFDQAILVSLGVGILIAGLTGVAISWLVAKRLAAPVADAASAVSLLADGRLHARVIDPGKGPEFTTLATSLNELAQHLEATEQTRRQLTGELAHQLRTPVASLSQPSRRYERVFRPSTTRPCPPSASRAVGSVGSSTISRWCREPRNDDSSLILSRLLSPSCSNPPWRPSGNGSAPRILSCQWRSRQVSRASSLTRIGSTKPSPTFSTTPNVTRHVGAP